MERHAGPLPLQWPSHVSASQEALAQPGAKPEPSAAQGPLADLQRWQIECLTQVRVQDIGLYRSAFTHKSALPIDQRVEKVGGGASCRPRRGEAAGEGKGLTCVTSLPHLLPCLQSYERLEFLGDAVQALTVRLLLMRRFPGSDEVRWACWAGCGEPQRHRGRSSRRRQR